LFIHRDQNVVTTWNGELKISLLIADSTFSARLHIANMSPKLPLLIRPRNIEIRPVGALASAVGAPKVADGSAGDWFSLPV
jgi:hypothetical protein